jgi:hypothetical protein
MYSLQEGVRAQLAVEDAPRQDALRAVRFAVCHHLPHVRPGHSWCGQARSQVLAVVIRGELRGDWRRRLRGSCRGKAPQLQRWAQQHRVHPGRVGGGVGSAALARCQRR